MKLSEFIYKKSIFLDVQADSQKNVFKILGNTFSKKNKTLSSLIIDKLNERERLGSTSVGNGIAIPHTKVDGINETQVIFLKLKNGVDFSASDGRKIDLVFSIIAPENSESDHLLILSSISSFIRKKQKVDRLRGSTTIDEVLFIFSKI